MTAALAPVLQAVTLRVPAHAVAAFAAALGEACRSVSSFHDEAAGEWVVEGIRAPGEAARRSSWWRWRSPRRSPASRPPRRSPTFAAEGWLARSYAGFAEQHVGRFAIRGTHITAPRAAGRITLCWMPRPRSAPASTARRAAACARCERVARRRPRRILDLGTGSGILAMAAARLLAGRVLASDIDPWSVRTARANAVQQRARPAHPRAAGRGLAQPARARRRALRPDLSPTSSPARSAAWPPTCRATWRPAASRSSPACSTRRRAGCWRHIAGTGFPLGGASPKIAGRRFCFGGRHERFRSRARVPPRWHRVGHHRRGARHRPGDRVRCGTLRRHVHLFDRDGEAAARTAAEIVAEGFRPAAMRWT